MIVKTASKTEQALPKGFRTRETNVKWDYQFAERPDYEPIGWHISYVPDVEYPFDEDMVERIRAEFDPGFVPLFRRLVYRTPAGGTLTIRHHGVGLGVERWLQQVDPDPVIVHAPKPLHGRAATWGRAVAVERWLAAKVNPRSLRAKHNLPGPFVAWGDWVYQWAREVYWEADKDTKQNFVEEKSEHVEKRQQRVAEKDKAAYEERHEAAYRRRHHLDPGEFGPDEERELLARQAGFVDTAPTSSVYVKQPAQPAGVGA